jgi:nucleoid DNA-binding protein
MDQRYETYTEDMALFGSSSQKPDRFASDLDQLVDRIRMLHWAMDTLANDEFSIHKSNEWMWKFSEFAFEAILRDTKRAASMANSIAGRKPRTAQEITIDALRTVQRDELQAQGLSYQEIEQRLSETIERVNDEIARQEKRHLSEEAA